MAVVLPCGRGRGGTGWPQHPHLETPHQLCRYRLAHFTQTETQVSHSANIGLCLRRGNIIRLLRYSCNVHNKVQYCGGPSLSKLSNSALNSGHQLTLFTVPHPRLTLPAESYFSLTDCTLTYAPSEDAAARVEQQNFLPDQRSFTVLGLRSGPTTV